MKKSITTALLLGASLIYSCGGKSGEAAADSTATAAVVTEVATAEASAESAAATAEAALKSAMANAEGTISWATEDGKTTYTFLQDGTFTMVGEKGEASAAKGTWTLAGTSLTLNNTTASTSNTVEVKTDGEFVVLGDVKYKKVQK